MQKTSLNRTNVKYLFGILGLILGLGLLYTVYHYQWNRIQQVFALTSVALRDAGDLDTTVTDSDDIESVLTGLSGETAIHRWSVDGASLNRLIMPFNAGAIQSDYSGNINNGNKVGMTFNSTASGLCRVGSCYSFNGTSDLMNYTMGNFGLSNATQGAVSAWVNTSANCAGTNGRCGIFELDYDANGNHRIQLALNTSNQVVFELYDGTTTYTLTSPGTVNNGAWRSIIGSWSSSGMEIFIDGVSVATNASVVDLGVFTAQSARTGALFNTANTPNTDDFYSGILDDIQVFQRAFNSDMASTLFSDGNAGITGGPTQIDSELTSLGEEWDLFITTHSTASDLDVTTIQSGNSITISSGAGAGLNNGGAGLSTSFDLTSQVTGLAASQGAYDWRIGGNSFLTLNLPFDNGGSQTDFSGNATGISFIDTPVLTTSGCQLGVCYEFDGVNDQVDTNLTLSSFISSTTGSMSLWVKPTGVSPAVSFAYNGKGVITSSFYAGVSRATIGGQDRLWAFNYDANEDRVGASYTVDEWTHLVWVHSGGKLRLYKDGTFIGEIESGNTQAMNQEVRIGGATSFLSPFEGHVDEVQIYDIALSPSQVTQLYSDTSSGFAAPRTIHSEHTNATEVWSLSVTPISSAGDIGSALPTTNDVTISADPVTVSLNSGTTTLDTYTPLISTVTGIPSAGGAYSWLENASPLMQLYYPMNSGAVQSDFSGNSRDGALTGGGFAPNWQGDCQIGGCMYFDGVNDQIDANVPLSTVMSDTEGSISAWVKPVGTAPAASFAYNGDSIISASFYAGLSRANIGGQDRLWAFNYDANEDRVGAAYTPDDWAHLVWVHGGGKLRLYKDGVFIGQVESNNTQAMNQEVRIGHSVSFLGPFQGYIDEVQVWNFALSADQVTNLFTDGNANNPGPTQLDDFELNAFDTFNLDVTPLEESGAILSATSSTNIVTIDEPTVSTTLNLGGTSLSTFTDLGSVTTGLAGIRAAYTWEENSSPYMQLNIPFNFGDTLIDYSGNGRNGARLGAAFSSSEQGLCQVGGCQFFDGVNDQIDMNIPLSTVMSNNEGTISLWARPTQTAPAASFAYNGDSMLSTSFYAGLSQANIGGEDRLWAFNYDGNEDRVGVTYNLDEWIHLTWVHGGGQLLIYKNGVLEGSVASGNTQATNQEVRIGASVSFLGPYRGYIDEVQVWDFALTSSQIQQNYADTSAGLSGPTIIKSPETVGADTWELTLTPLEEDGSALSLVDAATTVTITVPPTSLNLNAGTTSLSTSLDLIPTISGIGEPQAGLAWEENGAPYLSLNYPFNLGATQFDYSGNGFDGTVIEAAFSPQGQGFCQVGGCMFFDGVNDQIDADVPQSSIMTNTEGTISLWARPTQAAPSVSFAYNGDSMISASFYSGLSQANIGGEDRLWAFNYDGDEDRVGAPYTLNEWTHLVWVHSGGQLRLYKDGVFVGSTQSGNTQAMNQEIRIGHSVSFLGPFQGYIDEVQTWDFGLTVSQIEQLYTDGSNNLAGPSQITSSETIVADVWDLSVTVFKGDGSPLSTTPSTNDVTIQAPSVTVDLNNGSTVIDPALDLTSQVTGLGPSAAAYSWVVNSGPWMTLNIPYNPGGTQVDYSGNNYDATTSGAAYSIQAEGNCQVGGCHFYDGVNDQDDVNQPLSSLINADSGTISLWARPTQAAPVSSFAYNGDSIISASFYAGLSQANIGGQDRLWAFNYDTNEDRIGATYTLDEWTHLVWIHDAGQLSFYKDGLLIGSVASGDTQAMNQEVRIGASVSFLGPFQGYIDEVQTWDFAIHPDQIAILYANGNARTAGPIDIADEHINLGDSWDLSVTPFESDGTPFTPNNSGNVVTGFINTPPNEPILVSPLDGATIADLTPTLTVTYTDVDTGQVGTVDFRVSSGSPADCLNDVNVVHSGTSSSTSTNNEDVSYTVGITLSDKTTYNWCARSDDSSDESNSGNFSTMGQFTVDLGTAPAIPVLVSPENAGTTNLLSPVLEARYSDVDPGDVGTTEFRITTGSAADCLSNLNIVWSGSSSVSITNNQTNTATVGISLTNLTTYNWCARNNDGVLLSNSGNFTTMGSFLVDTSYSPGGGVGTILNQQQQGGGGQNNGGNDPETPQEPADIQSFDVQLSFVDINNSQNSNRLEPDRILFGTLILQNSNAVAANDVFMNLPLPEYLLYIPSSLQIDGQIQTDTADTDPGQANQNAISAIWASFAPGETKIVTFQLLSDFDALAAAQSAAIETIVLQATVSASNAFQDFASNAIEYTVEVPDPINPEQESETPVEENQGSSPTEPQEQTEADQTQSDTGDDATDETVDESEQVEEVQEPESQESEESQETQPDAEPTQQPTQPTTPDSGIPPQLLESESQTTQSPIIPLVPKQQNTGGGTAADDGQETQSDEEGGENLFITGNVQSQNQQIEFSGTVNEPNTPITVVVNNETFNVTSDENGFWQAFVSAEQIGVQDNSSQQVDVEAYAVSPETGKESNRISQQIFVERFGEALVIDQIAVVQPTTTTTTVSVFEELTTQVQEIIEEQEEEIQATLAVTAPVVVATSVPLWGYLPYVPTMFFHFISWIVGLLGRKKQQDDRFYGIVYDSISKQPLSLAIVRIYKLIDSEPGLHDNHARQLVKTVVTDKQGRYEALLEPGEYAFEVKKPQFSFPSSIVKSTSDGDYGNVLQGTVRNDQGTVQIPDIPIDPENAPKKWQTGNAFKKFWLALQKVGNYLAVPVLLLGALSAIMVLVNDVSSPINWILALLYVFLLIMQITFRTHPQRAWGMVYDVATNAALPLTTLQLIDPEFGKVVKSRLSDYEGRFSFLPEPGKYVIKASKEGYMQAEVVESRKEHNPIQGEVTIQKEGEHIDGDVAMRQN